MFRKGKFATLFEILPDLILKALYKENKNKKVKVKSPDTAAAVFELRVFEVWVVSSFSAASGDLTLTFLFLFAL